MGDRRSTSRRATWPMPSTTSCDRAASANSSCSLHCGPVHTGGAAAPGVANGVEPGAALLPPDPRGHNGRGPAALRHGATFGLIADLVEEALLRGVGVAESGGFPVKGVENVSRHGDFIGVRFDGERGRAPVAPRRIWRLRFAILELLKLEKFDGARLMRLIGHYTYVALLRRETLCIFSAAYAFVRASGGSSMRIWPSVRRELEWAGAILPLIFSDFLTPWALVVYASDASARGTNGFGVMSCWTGSDWAAGS